MCDVVIKLGQKWGTLKIEKIKKRKRKRKSVVARKTLIGASLLITSQQCKDLQTCTPRTQRNMEDFTNES